MAEQGVAEENVPMSSAQVRQLLVDRIRSYGYARTDAVEQAMRKVERHVFVPAVSIAEAYADDIVITKRDSSGAVSSSASMPSLMAIMLDQLDIRPGMKVLEIGTGTGYNAALLASVVGDHGAVTSIDIDEEVVNGARVALDNNGFASVRTLVADGGIGEPDGAPYDRIIATVGAWDIPRSWCYQLADGGKLVVPLRWRGQSWSVGFDVIDGLLRSTSAVSCGFVPMIGQEDGERTEIISADGFVQLVVDADQAITSESLVGVLDQEGVERWSKATIGGGDIFDGIWFRMSATEPGCCRLTAAPEAIQQGLCRPVIAHRNPALADATSVAYLTVRPRGSGPEGPRFELGAIGHGPSGADLAQRLCSAISDWDLDRTAIPTVVAGPAGSASGERASGMRIEKTSSWLELFV
ncbi:methyltransferase, FxLD system [Antrihabitans sp. NCIMB 15449]|uniref:Protein-L-isoaspartate O-methyltransferase n=1 Tax=Antrihabitans spumae TaxID=3373370 RepID=A0ABW7JK50_9NOCA